MTLPPPPATSPETGAEPIGTGPVAAHLVDADLIVAAVLGCPSVAALHGGRFGEVATYLPGRRVPGVRHDGGRVAVHVVGRYPASVTDIAGQVRDAVAAVLPGPVVDVTVEDYLDPHPPSHKE